MIGWDGPTQGFFAQRYNDEPEPDIDCYHCPYGQFELDDPDCSKCELQNHEEFDVLIGFGFSVSMEQLIIQCARYDFELDRATIQLLHKDRKGARPQTPLQENIQALFEGLIPEGQRGPWEL
jgi:hypothetical protein